MPTNVLRPPLRCAARVAVRRALPGMLALSADIGHSSGAALALIGQLDALPPLVRDAACAGACLAGALAWIGLWTQLARSGAVSSTLSRKMVHVGSAPLFVLVWPFFSSAASARLLASAVPALNAVRLLLAARPPDGGGAGDGIVAAVSRSGERGEILKGPFIYVLVLLAATLLCWRDSPVGVVALCQMAVGDGLADIAGRRFGKNNKWPFAPSKSVAGSLAFVLGATAASLGLLSWLGVWGCLSPLPADAPARLLLISVMCASVELLPTQLVDDNVSVPLAAAALMLLLLP
ncbi:hypothetical protein T492DRAFT_952769 [Pavlovales sp. CCMP2436]|nr:hypothetical protein T492DRAFT_952769 [Pavlovales sp. CCMP2436]|mmetsp:Transcript_17223/g.44128  ORF Transcript_17223/g.44128 Transcript_17223/m.44128 type:complete len:292 (-) Transcript_17223:90-965(-)